MGEPGDAVRRVAVADAVGSGGHVGVDDDPSALARLSPEGPPFGLAWSAAVFHHLTDPVAVLAGIARHVRPGGTVAVVEGDDGLSFPMLPWPPALELRLREAVVRGRPSGTVGCCPSTTTASSGAVSPPCSGWLASSTSASAS